MVTWASVVGDLLNRIKEVNKKRRQHNTAHPMLFVTLIKWLEKENSVHSQASGTHWWVAALRTEGCIWQNRSCASVNSGLCPLIAHTNRKLLSLTLRNGVQALDPLLYSQDKPILLKLFCCVCPIITHETYLALIARSSPLINSPVLTSSVFSKHWTNTCRTCIKQSLGFVTRMSIYRKGYKKFLCTAQIAPHLKQLSIFLIHL